MKEQEFTIRFVNEMDDLSIKAMYLKDIEEDHEKAARFAHSLIYKVKTIACFHAQEVIGTISWDVRGGLEDGVIELAALGVSPSFHRQGIARKLVLTMIKEAIFFFSQHGYKLRVIFLYMERKNEVGRKFYNRLGFREIFTIPSFLPHDDAVFWIKYF